LRLAYILGVTGRREAWSEMKKVGREKGKGRGRNREATDGKEWIRRLEAAHPDAKQALVHSTPLELLVALILAAQCTDERVNQVTESLFRKYRSAEDYAGTPQEVLEEEVRPTGFYRNKARAVRSCCREIVDRFAGEVPEAVEDLVSLPGVGRKTANIVIGCAFGRPAVGVDTHVKRLAVRMGFSAEEDPDRIEQDLCRIVPREKWVRFCHLLQFHGRRICLARRPRCGSCPCEDLCPKIGVES
jgi:endonuclease-3